MVSKRAIKSYLSKIRKLIEEGKLSKSDFIEWLRRKGIKASTRTPWDTLLERIYEAGLEVEELDRFVARYSRVRRVVKRKIEEVIAEEAEEAEAIKERASRVRAARRSTVITRLVGLITDLYPSSKDALEHMKNLLEELSVRYNKKAESLGELLESLSASAQEKLYEELKRIKSWRAFQEEVKNWIAANIPEARELAELGAKIKTEVYTRGYSGLNYRIDVYAIREKSEFFGSKLYYIAAECKNYKDPVDVTDVMIFKCKIEDILGNFERKINKPRIMMFSSSGYTERAIDYAKTTPVIHLSSSDQHYYYPIELYEKKGNTFQLVAKTEIK